MGKAIKRVQWHEGMLLEPQHFQQQDLHARTLSLQYLTTACPFFWGVRDLIIDETALIGGLVRLTKLSAVMPDGTYIAVDETDTDYPQIDLKTIEDLDVSQPITLCLAVVRYRPDSANTTSEFPRYDSVQDGPIIDENTGRSEIYMPKLRTKIYLIVGDVPPRYVYFPLAKILKKDDGFVLGDFIPPRVDIFHGSLLSSLLIQVTDSLREKVSFLSSKIQTPIGTSDSPLLDKYTEFFNRLAPLLPDLEALINAQLPHPFVVYTALCRAAGVISCLINGQVPPLFKRYDHNDLSETFSPVFDFINKTLDIVKRISTSVSFALDERTFSLALQPTWVWNNLLILGIRLSPGMTQNDATNWVKGAIIASNKYIPQVRDKRILGAARTIVDEVPDLGLVSNKGIVFVEVTFDDTFIDPSDTLQTFNISDTADTRPAEVMLYITETNDSTAT